MLRKIIADLKTNGTAAIYCDNSITYLDEFINSPSPIASPAKLEKYKVDLQYTTCRIHSYGLCHGFFCQLRS